MKHALAALTLTAAVVACASAPAPYGPAAHSGGPGYSETAIENDRYRVTFRANDGGVARAQELALARAAELTLQRGYDWFVVTQRFSETNSGAGAPHVTVGVGGGSHGGHASVGVSTGIGFPIGGGASGSAAILEIRLGRGAKPADDRAYDAREVQRALAATPK